MTVMKDLFKLLFMAIIIVGMNSCLGDDFDDSYEDIFTDETGSTGNGTSGQTITSAAGTLKELLNLDITIDDSALEETEKTPELTDEFYEDYAELDLGFAEAYVVNIAYNGNTATVSGDTEAVTVKQDGADVTVTSEVKGVRYVLSGTTDDGSFKIYSSKKFKLDLNGVSITNPTGAAINNQGKRAYVELISGTTNSLCDGSSYTSTPDDEDEKGTFFSEGKLAFSGTGSLSVTSKGKHGIVSDDYILFRPGVNISVTSTSGHCIKSNDGIIIRGGVINAQTSAEASKGITTDGMLTVEGGRTTLITSGNAVYDSDEQDVSGAAGAKADSVIVIAGGQFYAKSTGKGGKGISTDQTFTITGGTVKVVTTGTAYTYNRSLDSKAKGIKADGNMYIKGGSIMAKTTGGEGSEAIETKGTLTVDGGSVATYSYDDGINSKSTMTINDGSIYSYATGNDGIDSNGNLIVNGGVVVGCGASAPEEGIDAAEGYTFSINGGTVVGIGGGGEAMAGSQQKASLKGVTVAGGNYIAVSGGSTYLFALQVPCSYSSATLQVSTGAFKSGTTYTLSTAAQSAVSGNTDFYGYIASPSVSSTSSLGTFTTSTSTTGGMSGNMGGGGPGGRR